MWSGLCSRFEAVVITVDGSVESVYFRVAVIVAEGLCAVGLSEEWLLNMDALSPRCSSVPMWTCSDPDS